MGNAFHPQRMINVIRRINRNVSFRRQMSHRTIKGFFTGIIGMGKNGANFVTGSQQSFNTEASHIVVGKNDGFHYSFSLLDGRITC
ncbi:hypothetical protein AJR28_006085 [Shigella flexneri]|nr:hypothetical protein SFy_3319 [Shigella flexneri 2003036]AIL41493.1 hypothetical protein SFyv_3394 [Shigella flexneri Shi06HN006]EFS15477.1 hypothetical protein SF2457T_0339 [Shigella flexneri 2a str. 2457T]EGJ85668.1 hypothetical protein SFK671_2845 [Shigella flexneri K-671]EGK35659.1 hypothetical protein SFK304_3063 [Shigella flexneri K-304]EIQ24617.1 hypothetical protein SFK404_3161 [Shigella flexneri K-404]OOP13716.1 hypothetical protein AJR25_018820 [Shigella flexneri]